jgi:hypothetical protein
MFVLNLTGISNPLGLSVQRAHWSSAIAAGGYSRQLEHSSGDNLAATTDDERHSHADLDEEGKS